MESAHLKLIACKRMRSNQRTERHIRWVGAKKYPVWSGQQRKSGRCSGWMSDWNANGKWSKAEVWKKKQRRRLWHAVQDVKNHWFVRHNASCGLEPLEKNLLVRKWDVYVGLVQCSHRLQKNRISKKHLDSGLKENIVHSNLMSVTTKKIAITKTLAIQKRAGWLVRIVPPPARLWVDTLRTFIVPSERYTCSLSNLLTGTNSCVSFATFSIKSFFILLDSW